MVETISKTREELLQNTTKRFNLNNRSIDDGRCKYLSERGGKCAIGCEISDELARKLDEYDGGTGVYVDEVFNALPMRLKKMGQDFLTDIQRLHDNACYWNSKGLSKMGVEKVNDMELTYLNRK